jgi:uncharacterized membrane protein YqhA
LVDANASRTASAIGAGGNRSAIDLSLGAQRLADDQSGTPDDASDLAGIEHERVHRVLAGIAGSSRFFALFAILGTALSAAAIFVYAVCFVVVAIWHAATAGTPSEDGLKHLTVELVDTTDSFLLGTVLYIVSIGFFQLFVDSNVPRPAWLRITNLDQLKSKLVGVVVVLLAVTFLGKVVDWNGDRNIAYLGVAIATVIAGLAYGGFRAHAND